MLKFLVPPLFCPVPFLSRNVSPDPPRVGYASSSTPKAASLKVLISCIQIFFGGEGEVAFTFVYFCQNLASGLYLGPMQTGVHKHLNGCMIKVQLRQQHLIREQDVAS